jgi:hypothetical protein
MNDLYEQLAAKMTKRPETNRKSTEESLVAKYFSGPAGQILLTWKPGKFNAMLGPGDQMTFWVAHDGAQGGFGEDGPYPRPVTSSEVAAILAAVPLPVPDSVYGYFARPDFPPSALAYWQEPDGAPNEPLRLSCLALDAQAPAALNGDVSAWWREVDAGRLRCLDEAVAAGQSVLAVEFDGKDYFTLVLDGREYLATGRLPGLMVSKEDLEELSMTQQAKQCVQERAAAAAALREM